MNITRNREHPQSIKVADIEVGVPFLGYFRGSVNASHVYMKTRNGFLIDLDTSVVVHVSSLLDVNVEKVYTDHELILRK